MSEILRTQFAGAGLGHWLILGVTAVLAIGYTVFVVRTAIYADKIDEADAKRLKDVERQRRDWAEATRGDVPSHMREPKN
jgi:succinate dehydrogenase hydrophobic anchor subunit